MPLPMTTWTKTLVSLPPVKRQRMKEMELAHDHAVSELQRDAESRTQEGNDIKLPTTYRRRIALSIRRSGISHIKATKT
jgi:hypothetical protein